MKKGGQIRIIGGRWKSRRLRFAGTPGLRPSPDAVRETLFNWLPRQLHDLACLDLYAGSGAFGFEAASRGARKVVMVESNPAAARMLCMNRRVLRGDAVEIFQWTVERFIRRHHGGFDIVFLDPPFDHPVMQSIGAACENLQTRGLLNPHALVYIESRHPGCANKHANGVLPIPADWHIIREKRLGMVQSTLIQASRLPPTAQTTPPT